MQHRREHSLSVRVNPHVVLWGITAALLGGLLVYSQTMGFVWDEGFHLLTAQLITDGKSPYIDFCFPQTPLNAYLNALCLQLFGQTWRSTHVLPAIFVAGSAYLSADFVMQRVPVPNWRLPAALVAALAMGLNDLAVQFGTVAQAYGSGMFFSVVAFRLALEAVSSPKRAWSFATGLAAGSAAGCTLLAAPVAPVLLLWDYVYNGAGNRLIKAGVFAAGCAIPFGPVFWLLFKAPRQTLFNVVEYQALFRRVNWPGATTHDVDVFTAWLNSTPALICGLFAIAGVLFLKKKSNWERSCRSEFYLCWWLAVGLTLYIATAHPTFQRYFVIAVPFYSMLAAVGLYWVGSRLVDSSRPFWPVCIATILLVLSLGKTLFDDREAVTWKHYEEVARKVRQVTPPGAALYADEHVYFILHRTPPRGMEFSYAHKLELPPAQEVLFNVVSEKELNRQVAAGKFATVQSCKEDWVNEIDLPKLFPHQADIADCSVFWGKVKAGPLQESKK